MRKHQAREPPRQPLERNQRFLWAPGRSLGILAHQRAHPLRRSYGAIGCRFRQPLAANLMITFLRWLYLWIIAVPCLGLSTLVLGLPIVFLAFLGMGDWCSRTLAVLWARFNAMTLGMQVHIEGTEHLKGGQSYVLTANHLSQVDILLIYGFLPLEFKWVLKKELMRVPIIGAACRAMGHIVVDRSNSQAAVASIQSVAHRLNRGMCVMFFPEGTRGHHEGQLLPFKRGAFRLAIDLKLPVLPMSISGTGRLLPTGTVRWRPGPVVLKIHPAITTQHMGDGQVSELSRKTESVIRSSLTP